MMDAIIQRYAVHEIVWQPGPGGLTAELRRVPLYFFENRSGKLRFIGPENRADGTELEDDGWMVTVAEGLGALIDGLYLREVLKSGAPNGAAAVETAIDYLNSQLEGRDA
jgi:hypothetical protein